MNRSAVEVLLEVDEPARGWRGTKVLMFILMQGHAATDTMRMSLPGNREGCRIV
jgi:sporulation-control protein spo0M